MSCGSRAREKQCAEPAEEADDRGLLRGRRATPPRLVDRTLKIRINGEIRGSRAFKQGLDLVEVDPNADVPVCKVVDFDKYKDEERRRAANAKRETDDADEPDE